jgi:hypothetical protein
MEGIVNNGHHGALEIRIEKKPLYDVRAFTGLTVVLFVHRKCNSNAKVEFMAGTSCIGFKYLELLQI